MARIALVVNSAWNVWNFRLTLLSAIEEAGHEVIVIAPADDYSAKLPFPSYDIPITSRSTNPLVDARLFLNFLKVYREVKPDVLLLYTAKPNVYGNFAARILGIRSISNIAGLGVVFSKSGLLSGFVKALYRMSLKVPDVVFFQNREDREQFVKEGIVGAVNTDVLPGSGVDLQRFDNDAVVAPRRASPKFVFLLSARMLWEKGVAEYVAAAERLLSEGADAEFRLVGFLDSDNPSAISSEEMKRLTSNPSIVYHGTSDEIEVEIAQADCFVLPTLYKEGTPKSLLEAAAMGKPLITTDAPGCRDVVDNGLNGYLWRPKDVDHLCELMKRMVEMEEVDRFEMGRKSRDKVAREFDDRIVINRYLSAIEDLLSQKG